MIMPDASRFYEHTMPASLPRFTDGSEPVWELLSMYPPQGRWTKEEYLDLTDSTSRLIEYSKGRLEFLAMPTRNHQRLVFWLSIALKAFVDERSWGEVLPGGIRLYDEAEDDFRIPDVIYLSKESEARWGGERYWQGADLAIEVVSDDQISIKRDYETKPLIYADTGVSEYWIVDPQESKITVLTLPEGAKEYAEHGVFVPGQTATSKLLEGFTVDVKACFDAAKA